METLIDLALLGLLAVTALAMLKLRNLFAVVMLSGMYSLLSAGFFVDLDAVDVAFTEAAVGAGITTVLMLGTLTLTTSLEKVSTQKSIAPFILVLATGLILVYGTLDMPGFGHPEAPIHHHVAPRYLKDTPTETGIPNVVTAVLASYRGYDTLGETTVIFTAGVGVLTLLGFARRKEDSRP